MQIFHLVLLDFSLTVKAATLIFISGRGSAISSATVVPRPLSNDPRLNQCIYCYGRASKRFVEV